MGSITQPNALTEGAGTFTAGARSGLQQPEWHEHGHHRDSVGWLAAAAPLVGAHEIDALRRALAIVAAGDARLLQAGDCAEDLAECGSRFVEQKFSLLEALAGRLAARAAQPVVRLGRMGGQFAKPRSEPTERRGDVELPSFRGHIVNDTAFTPEARRHDPMRMVRCYQASAEVLTVLRSDHERRGGWSWTGPWASHEALVLDYEHNLRRTSPATGSVYLASTHLPWIGERTRQPDRAHVALAAEIRNPVGCKVGPTATVDDVLTLCRILDPDRRPGRLVLIPRLGRGRVREILPDLARAVRRAGHPVVWLCDPMHGNTVQILDGLKTRYLDDLLDEARAFRQILERCGLHPAGLHLEVAAGDVTECVGGAVLDEASVPERYTTLCDPRLNPDQAFELVDRWL